MASEISFSDGLKNKTRAACRIFGLGDIKKSFKKILNDFRPDIVHFHNIHSYLSPGCRKIGERNMAVVLFGRCTIINCYVRRITAFVKGKFVKPALPIVFKYFCRKCMKGSWIASALACGEALWWNRKTATLGRYFCLP
ncbi:MAG: hypothetical protein ACLU18_16190 [Bacteroides thetaiotaomicron]